jgi:hypothetical protein
VHDFVNWMEQIAAKYPGASLVVRVEERGVVVLARRRSQTDASARTIGSAEPRRARAKPSANVLAKSLSPELPHPDNTNRQQPYYSIPELAVRWRSSRATVYNRLRFAGAKVLDLGPAGKKGKKLVPALTVFQIESKNLKALP